MFRSNGALKDPNKGNSANSKVHFYVQRDLTTEYTKETPPDFVTFQIEKLNIGGSMNMKTRIFTAPVAGVYYFDFSDVQSNRSPYEFTILLFVNGAGVGAAVAGSNQHGLATSLSLNAHLYLKEGDKVRLFKSGPAELLDKTHHSTHSSGWLVQEF